MSLTTSNGTIVSETAESESSSSGPQEWVQIQRAAKAVTSKGKWQQLCAIVGNKGKGKEDNNEPGKGKGTDDNNNTPKIGKGKKCPPAPTKCKVKKDDDDPSDSSAEGSVVLPTILLPKKRKKRERSPSF
jgi:hypothetical protein